ncbi:hypothetical protein B0H16DRAFT_1466332 [Mycena metata]|uniref:DUF6699 domain-containing protein n=1 Tax=Mycena metata TaxID=1033252 RepID=A0AAD7I7V2_9AGAR|nr:hypothetical protein B0H16DRAFT_1466332 [Mycena metata]
MDLASAVPDSLPPPTPPPPPQPNQDLPLPVTLEIHLSLSSNHALPLDFSYPSAAFRRNPQLTTKLMNEPACTPPQTMLRLRISEGLYHAEFDVVHNPRTESVTVGDFLTAIQRRLRHYDYGRGPLEAHPYLHRRIATVNGYCRDRDPRREAENIAAERDGGGRFVDHLLGHTLFVGMVQVPGTEENVWTVGLSVPERYAK